MAAKTGKGGHGQENYDPNTGKYVDSNSSTSNAESSFSDSMSLRTYYALWNKRIRTPEDLVKAIENPNFQVGGKKSTREAKIIGNFYKENGRLPNEKEWESLMNVPKLKVNEDTAMEMFGLSSNESIEDVDDWMFEDEPENDPFNLVREDKDSFVVDKDRLETVKSELEYDGFETEEGSPTFDDIYNDFVKEKNKQPNGAYEILDFVKEKVGEDLSKGDDIRYKVKTKIRKSALPKSTATAVQEEY